MKTLVNVKVPAIQKEMDMLIPDFLPMRDATVMTVDALKEQFGDVYPASGEEVFCHGDSNRVLSMDSTLADNEVKNGDTLILI